MRLLAVMVRGLKAILVTAAVFAALGVVTVLVRDEVYRASTVVVPSVHRGGAAGLLSAQLPPGLAGLAGAAAEHPGQRLITAILQSRTLADSMFARVGPPPDEPDLTAATFRERLRERTRIRQNSDGSYEITVDAESGERAAHIAALYPQLLNTISSALGAQALEVKRLFLEGQLALAQNRLMRSEESLLAFQEREAAPEIQEQGRQTLEAAVALQREILAKEVEISRLRLAATPENPELQAAIAEVGALRAQLRRLTTASSPGDFFVPLERSPELKVASLRLLREYTKDEQIYLALTASVAESQVDVQTNLPVVSVLDGPVTPRRPAGLPAPVVIFLMTWLGLVVGVGVALLLHLIGKLRRHPEASEVSRAWRETRLVPTRRTANPR